MARNQKELPVLALHSTSKLDTERSELRYSSTSTIVLRVPYNIFHTPIAHEVRHQESGEHGTRTTLYAYLVQCISTPVHQYKKSRLAIYINSSRPRVSACLLLSGLFKEQRFSTYLASLSFLTLYGSHVGRNPE